MRKRRSVAGAAALAGFVLLAAFAALAQPPFHKDFREKLAFLHQRGAERVQLHVVARAGRNAELAAELQRRGGEIRFRADDIDYLRVLMPLRGIAEMDALLALPALEAATPSLSGHRADPTLKIKVEPVEEGPEPPTPLLRPYRPIADLDGLEWQRRHPTFDGRGVGIAMLDGIPDLLHPDLQRATDLQGRSVPKLVEVQYTGNARDDGTDTFWIRMPDEVQARNGRFAHAGRTYAAPHDGAFRFALLPRPTAFTRGTQVPVAAVEGGDPSHLPLLWERATDTVWVDTNVDGSFADEKPMQPYEQRGDIGLLGRDDPATPTRETLGFTVTIDRESEAVRFNPGWAVHGTIVAGSAVAAGMNGGAFDALAGQARLGSYETSGTHDAYNVPETVYRAMKDPRMDVLFYEWNYMQFGDYALRDGRNALSIAIDRIAARFRKPMFVPANNSPGMLQVADLSVPEHAISVGAYDSGEALRANYAAASPYRDNLHMVGSFGPAGNGALKPDLLAPSGHITTNVMFFSDLPRRLKGHFQLPPAYIIGGGTSCATPTAAAAAALLISAAKQEGVDWDEARLRYALYSTARFLDDTPAYQQGRGLIQIGKAWDALVALDRILGWEAPRIEVDAPVRTTASHLLPTPHRGVGLFEREGWRAHQRGRREIVFTRRNGPAAPVTYRLQWQGDTAAFRSPATLTLPLNEPVALTVDIATAEPRAYSALLRLREPDMPVESLSVLATVVAAEAPDASAQHTLRKRLSLRRPGVESVFVHVPPGTRALYAAVAKDSPETLNLSYLAPDSDRVVFSAVTLAKGVAHKVAEAPAPGVWELLFYNRSLLRDYGKLEALEPRPDPLTPTAVDLEVKLLGAEPQAAPAGTLALRNAGASVAGKVLWGHLGSAFEQPVTLRADARQSFRVSVPKGARLLRAELERVEDPDAEITLLAYEVKDGQAIERQKARGLPGAAPMMRIVDPAPGEWRIVVEPYRLSGAQAGAVYRDLVVHEAYGALKPAAERFELPAAGQWRTALATTPAALPVAPRRPVGVLALGVEAPGPVKEDGKPPEPEVFLEAVVPLER